MMSDGVGVPVGNEAPQCTAREGSLGIASLQARAENDPKMRAFIASLDADKDEFFGFLPSFQGSALPGAAPLAFSTPCFGAVRVAASLKNGSVEVAFQAKQRRSASLPKARSPLRCCASSPLRRRSICRCRTRSPRS